MSQIVPVAIQMLMFLSPVFYPAQAVPEGLRSILSLNPLSPVIEAMRSTISGSSVDWYSWSIALVIGSVFLILGYVFFNRSREEFADAL
jgi:lipopolysaccharide transport system permease protein